jgi:hypothetical protein
MSRGRRVSFVVRVVEDRQGQMGGVIERVATGAKESFRDLDAVGRVLRTMLSDERPRSPSVVGPPPSPEEISGLPGSPPGDATRREHATCDSQVNRCP